jgi:hypothetical protein
MNPATYALTLQTGPKSWPWCPKNYSALVLNRLVLKQLTFTLQYAGKAFDKR